jgi:hypothetical protein
MKHTVHEIDALLVSIGRSGRLGDFGDAARDLNRCLVLFQSIQGTMSQVPKPLLEKFNYSLETVFLMLKNKDWVAIADIVEYELRVLWLEMAGSIGGKNS